MTVQTAQTAGPAQAAHCHAACTFGQQAPDHHDRLLSVEADLDGLLDLMELALTWGELDYSRSTVIPPRLWPAFVDSHEWCDPERVRRIFDLATDVALRSDPWTAPIDLSMPGQQVRPMRTVAEV